MSAVDRPRFAFTIYLVGGRGLGFACNLEAFYRTEGHVFLGQSYLRGVFEFQAKCNSYLLRHSLNVVHAEERATNRPQQFTEKRDECLQIKTQLKKASFTLKHRNYFTKTS